MGHKRIIGGKAYNTDTSALVFEIKRDPDGLIYEGLYQTKHGAFFLWWYNAYDAEGDVKPMSDGEALDWLEKRQAPAVIVEQYFGPFPEGGAAESRLTLRLPGNLYNRLSKSATAANLSINTYIMRLLERNESPSLS
jgi:hypothetical protein